MNLKRLQLSALVFFAAPLFAINPEAVGLATSIGSVAVNQATVSGSAELLDGSRLDTTSVPADVKMQSGADVRMATRSSGSFFTDHIALNEGALRVGSFNGLTVNAAQLQITSDELGSKAVVRLTKKTVEVASLGGSVSVLDGGMLTRVAAGTKMSFQQTGGTPQTGVTPADQSNSSTGANPAPAPGQKKMPSDEKTFLWVIGIAAVAALAIGLTAAAEGKSPF